MGGPPAVIIVVRHGARLDAADKQWHLNSPTPYDPPLTYGGWTQCRNLGVRIANLLAELPPSSSQSSEQPFNDQPKRKRKQRVVIHSSPFLRCIQTSIALASGMTAAPSHPPAQNEHSLARRAVSGTQLSHSAARPSSKIRVDSPMLAPLPEAPSPTTNLPTFPDSSSSYKDTHTPPPIPKAILRVDAFLGEWLSPDYFEQITPPPSSVMMVAAAKADLLRREDYAHLNTGPPSTGTLSPPTSGSFPGGWGSSHLLSKKKENKIEEKAGEDGDDDLPGPALPLPKHNRTSSMSSVGSSSSSRLSGHPTLRSQSSQGSQPHHIPGYHPPVPHYAISSSDPIPPGFVAHSKDACVDVDYQWDSMREPQNWGDGGEYGEEWGSMHKRFRRGLKMMVEWYRNHDAGIVRSSSRPGSRPGTSGESPSGLDGAGEEEEEEEEEEELVIILVTHGAGCNALIGALTSQPALLDVGMANLTMAVRRPPYVPPTYHLSPNTSRTNTPSTTPRPTPRPTPAHSRSGSRVLTLSDEYELTLLNSSEHLRRSSNVSTASSFSSNLPNLPYRPFLRSPATVNSGSDSGSTPFIEPLALSSLSATGYNSTPGGMSDLLPGSAGLRRTVSVASGSGSTAGGRTYTPRFKGSVGLWSPRKPSSHEEDEKEREREKEREKEKEDTRGDDMVLNFAEEREARESQLNTPAAVPTTPSAVTPAVAAAEIGDPFSRLKIRDDATKSEIASSRHERTSSGNGTAEAAGIGMVTPLETQSPNRGGGLWSEKKLPEEAGLKPKREPGPKRRWTLTEDGAVREHGLDRV